MTRSRSARRWPRRLHILLLFAISLALLLWFTLTAPSPLVPPRPAPTAIEVGAGRDAYRQLRAARGNRVGARITLTPEHLAGLGALVSHGFRPDRLALTIAGNEFRLDASHHLPLSRWLNVSLRAEAPSTAFPVARMTIGSLSLPPYLTRWTLQLGRKVLSWRRHIDIPALDQAVRAFAIKDQRVSAMIVIPATTGLIDQMASVANGDAIDTAAVVRIYCALAKHPGQPPSTLFADQVHRAFSVDQGDLAPSAFNRAAFIALGMYVVDLRVADLAEIPQQDFRKCVTRGNLVSIYQRGDWPKHWALSAAIDVSSGTQLSEAVGEWKELSDSLSKQSQFAIGDPSGFSMADLGADRAGFRVARAASNPVTAIRMKQRLAGATEEALLPHALIEREDGMSNADFVKRYGGLDDPRFRARIAQIDAELDRSGIR